MRIFSFITCLMALVCQGGFSQHVPPCGGLPSHSTSICWGYAVGRTFFRYWGDPRCDLSTLHLTQIPSQWFDSFPLEDLQGIQVGDIVTFSGHAAYVSRVQPSILVDQVPNVGGPQQLSVPLQTVINEQGQGTPNGYWRVKRLWSIGARNSFEGGTVLIGGQSFNSGEARTGLRWGQSYVIDAEMDGQEYENYVQRFDEWTRIATSETHGNRQWPIFVHWYDHSQTEWFRAEFRREFNVNISAATYIEQGSGGGYRFPPSTDVAQSWSGVFLEESTSPIVVEAVPPTDWVLVGWSDGPGGNPRDLLPTDHTLLHSIFKAHLGSSLADATSSNSQRKMAAVEEVDENIMFYLGYGSAGEVWVTESTDGGATWNAEQRASDVYFARFIAISALGGMKYSKVNKLLLMK